MSNSATPAASPPDPPGGRSPGDSRGPRRLFGALAAVLVAGLLGWHGYLALAIFPPGAADAKLPFTEFDHPFHFYYANRTRDFFQNRTAFSGYDPTFMAGYAKTLIFPSSSTLPELVAIAAGPSPRAYRAMVALAVWLVPLLLGFAALVAVRSWSAFAAAVLVGVPWFWCGFPNAYFVWGMGPFIVASCASLWGGILLARWLDTPRRGLWIGGTVVAAVSSVLHPSSAVILTAMLWPAYLVRLRQLHWRQHLIAWCVPLLVLLIISPWWYPAWRLRESFGTTASGFVNENIEQRMLELVRAEFPSQTASLLLAPFAALYLRGVGRAVGTSLVAGSVQFFGIAYFASALPGAWFLQPGRYDQPLYALLLVVIVGGWVRAASALRSSGWRSQRVAWSLLAVASALSAALVAPLVLLWVHSEPIPVRHALPGHVLELAERLKQFDLQSGRVLFEDRGRAHLDPFDHTNPSALLPLLAPGQYIGGPYLHTHLKTNATQCGNGELFAWPIEGVDSEMFRRWTRQYNLRWAVFWSPRFIQFASRQGGLLRRVARIGPVSLYEIANESNWAAAGHARVIARPDRLEVHDARPGPDGTLILSYHWISTLRGTVPIYPVTLPDDPVPFIAVQDPPESFVIENRLW